MKKPKKAGVKVYTFTRPELNKFIQKNVARKLLSLFLAAAAEEFCWTADDVERFNIRLERYMNAVDSGLITLTTVEQLLGDELLCDIVAKYY